MSKTTANEQTELMRRLSQAATGWLLDINPRTLRDAADAPRNADKSYNGRELVKWLVARTAAGAGDDSGDPLLAAGGGASPALEEYRRHRAALAGLELDERRGRLVDIDTFTTWWESEVAAPIRRAIEALQRLETITGPDAAAMMTKALQRAETAVEQRNEHD